MLKTIAFIPQSYHLTVLIPKFVKICPQQSRYQRFHENFQELKMKILLGIKAM